MKKLHRFILIAIGVFGVLVTGCATKPGGDGGIATHERCQRAQAAVEAYELVIASGLHEPTKDETLAYMSAKGILMLYCGPSGPAPATKDIAKIPKPPEPARLTVAGTKYRIVEPFRILDTQGESVFRGRKDITMGPLYVRVKPRGEPKSPRDACEYIPDAAYLTGESKRPTSMHPIGCPPQ